MTAPQRIVVIGATSAIAHQCCRLWAAQSACDFLLVSRSTQRSEVIATDLRTRGAQVTARAAELRFDDVDAITTLVREATANGSPDIVLIAHGSLPDQVTCQDDLHAAWDALLVNGLSSALIAEAFIGSMQLAGRGRLCVIGSVAGDRGRKSNYIYGAAKGLVDKYAQGLQHRLALAGSPVRVTLAKPGPTDTPMTAQLKQRGGKLASAEAVAQVIVKAIDAGKPVVYAPAKWALIMGVIRKLPRFVFNKVDV